MRGRLLCVPSVEIRLLKARAAAAENCLKFLMLKPSLIGGGREGLTYMPPFAVVMPLGHIAPFPSFIGALYKRLVSKNVLKAAKDRKTAGESKSGDDLPFDLASIQHIAVLSGY